MSYEVVVVGKRNGRRYSYRESLAVPLAFAVGRLERLTDQQIQHHLSDLVAEIQRRSNAVLRQAEIAATCGGYDPFASQFNGAAA